MMPEVRRVQHGPWAPQLGARVALAFDVASALVVGVVAWLVVTTFGDYAVTWDESWHLTYGDHILAWFVSLGRDTSALCYRIDYMYGGGFDLLGAIARELSPLSDYKTIHLVGALIGVLGVVGTWSLARRLAGPAAGFAAVVMLATTSVYYGHMFNNPKDLPFAVGYVWAMDALCAIVLALPQAPRRAWVRFAVCAGLAMGVRIAGILLLIYLVAAVLGLALLRTRATKDLRAGLAVLRRLGPATAWTVAGAWLVMLSTWPWALLDPLRRPWLALGRMSRFTVHEREMPFAGELMMTTEPRWDYLAHYFGLKLPLLVLGLVAAAVVMVLVVLARRSRRTNIDRAKRNVGLVLAASIMAPPTYAIVVRSVLYDGLRHFLFLVPLLVVVAAVAMVVLPTIPAIRARRATLPVALAIGLFGTLAVGRQIQTMRQLHPFQYIYFNELIGGPSGAFGNYDTDYYGNAYKEGFTALAEHLWETERDTFLETRYMVSGCIPDFIARDYVDGNFAWIERGKKGAEFYLGYTRSDCHLRRAKWPEMLRVERLDTLLLVVRDLRRPPKGIVEDKPRPKARPQARPKIGKPKTRGNRPRPTDSARPLITPRRQP